MGLTGGILSAIFKNRLSIGVIVAPGREIVGTGQIVAPRWIG